MESIPSRRKNDKSTTFVLNRGCHLLVLLGPIGAISFFLQMGRLQPFLFTIDEGAKSSKLSHTNIRLNATQLLQSGHFADQAKAIDRVFPTFPQLRQSYDLCSLKRIRLNPNKQQSTNNSHISMNHKFLDPLEGIFYNKVPKSGSSTLAAINIRLAIHWGYRLYHNHSTVDENTPVVLEPKDQLIESTTCAHKQNHALNMQYEYGNRVANKSFFWGSIRDPASRALSRVFFTYMSQEGIKPNNRNILWALQHNSGNQNGCISNGQGGFQMRYLSTEPIPEGIAWNETEPTIVTRQDKLMKIAKRIMEEYNFIAVTERMDESLVVLQMLLGLRTGDILSTPSKVAGSSFFLMEGRCIPLQKSFRSPAVQEYLQSDEWQAINYGDYLLYAAVNQSLDRTIDYLGKDIFQSHLQRFQNAQRIVNERCASEAKFPCSANGTLQTSNCYSEDMACGYACLDMLTREYGW